MREPESLRLKPRARLGGGGDGGQARVLIPLLLIALVALALGCSRIGGSNGAPALESAPPGAAVTPVGLGAAAILTRVAGARVRGIAASHPPPAAASGLSRDPSSLAGSLADRAPDETPDEETALPARLPLRRLPGTPGRFAGRRVGGEAPAAAELVAAELPQDAPTAGARAWPTASTEVGRPVRASTGVPRLGSRGVGDALAPSAEARRQWRESLRGTLLQQARASAARASAALPGRERPPPFLRVRSQRQAKARAQLGLLQPASTAAGADSGSGSGAGAGPEWCAATAAAHGVLVGTSWGSLPLPGQREWETRRCDDEVHKSQSVVEKRVMANYTVELRAAVAERPPRRRIARASGGGVSVVAVCVSTTSRGTRSRALGELALFSVMLPSLRDSILQEHPPAGLLSAAPLPRFEYWVYVAYDAGDAFYDSATREAELRAWLDGEFVAPLAARGVTTQHALLRYRNVLRKPGPAFNFMMAAAYADGADYLYRVNDDTRFVGPWASAAAGVLAGFSPPNVGVVGPVCEEGNARILTHDLTHRTHMAIFGGVYYPAIFTDWWMDDWITRIYAASHRMARGPFRVQHLIEYQGTRYEVDHRHEASLERELELGQAAVQEWVEAQRRSGGFAGAAGGAPETHRRR